MAASPPDAFVDAVRTDLAALYPGRSSLGQALALLVNPSAQACMLVRACQYGPRSAYWLFRQILMAKHGIDVGFRVQIGPGLKLPHPVAIVIGAGAKLGANVTVYQGVTLGQLRGHYPMLGDSVVVFPNAVVVGRATIGDSAQIGATLYVSRDVPAGSRFTGR